MKSHFQPDGQLHPCELADGLYTAQLPSGLKVLIREQKRTPVAVCNVWIPVGSNREPRKLRGWSHGIEHMLFKGTQRRQEGDFAREVAEAGGSTNAGTGYETTNYHITLPAENLAVAVDILGDALLNSRFDPESLDAERQVLVHENHMYDDIPFGFGVTWRWAMELAFDRSPYAHPIGGLDANLLERDRRDILAFYRSAYRPDNMVVAIVGDVNPQTALDLVKEKFVPPAQEDASDPDPEVVMVASPPTEEPHPACRVRVEHGDIKRAYCKLVFPGPGEFESVRPVLSVVRRALSDGRSCRLYRQLQEEMKLVDDFTVMTETGPREGVIIIDLETDPERLPRAMAQTATILRDLARDGCTVQERDRASVRVARSFLFGEETVQGQASTLGYHAALDYLEDAFTFPAKVAAVTGPDTADFCGSVFQLENLTCVIYLPRGVDPLEHGIPTDSQSLEGLLSPHLIADDTPPAASVETEIQAPLINLCSQAGVPHQPFEMTRLGNGSGFCYRVDRTLPVVAMNLTVIGGATEETATNAGLSTLAQVVQAKGAGNLNSEQIHEALEGEGASLAPRTERDFTGLGFSGLSDRLDRALDLLGLVVAAPSFPPQEIEQEKRLALEQLAAIEDSPFQAAALEFRQMLYGDHPYGRPVAGTLTSLPNLDRSHLQERHRQSWTASNLQIVVSGNFDPDGLGSRLEELLAELPAGITPDRPDPGTAQVPQGIVSRQLSKDQNQSVCLVGWPGVLSPEADRVPVMMLKEILNGQAGRLFESLRNRRSLCYNTGTLSTAGFGQGMFLGYVLTSPQTEADAREALVEELAVMTRTAVSEEEMERARAKLMGNLLISQQSNASHVARAGRDLVFGRDPNGLPELVAQIKGCLPEQVMAVARQLIDPDHRYQVTIGPE